MSMDGSWRDINCRTCGSRGLPRFWRPRFRHPLASRDADSRSNFVTSRPLTCAQIRHGRNQVAYQPVDCGCVLYRDPQAARITFDLVGDYARSWTSIRPRASPSSTNR